MGCASRSHSLLIALMLALLPTCAAAAEPEGSPSAEQLEFFEAKIRPVLVARCYSCHAETAKSVKGGLKLDARERMRTGGESGSAVVPGDAAASLLIQALRYEAFEMPPDGKLPDDVIADFVKWVELGAPDPRDEPARPHADEPGEIDWDSARTFWAFQQPRRHAPPPVSDAGWMRRPIDAFILARLDAAGMAPSPPADRRTLIRRVTFDVVGLPPDPEQVEDFVGDESPQAYARLVDSLLASPRYGERWARLWLDVARYAEDQAHIVGNDRELCYPNAYLYRDWVIAAFNVDMPYDEFVRLQIAADLLHADDNTHHAALGFIGLGPKYYRRKSPEVMAEEWEDRVDAVSRGLLGLTVACARCHDHKFDPIPTEDYYALAGVFASTVMFNRPLSGTAEVNDKGEAKKPDDALHVIREDEPRDLAVMIRGDVKNRGAVVPRRFLKVLCEGEPHAFRQGSGRLELAESITGAGNPLTARVIVNRVWAEHFGKPLVGTPSNFGAMGQWPSHPELLDDLSVRFMENGWSLKWLHREILLSATYQQSAELGARNAELGETSDATSVPHSELPAPSSVDPENRLLGRMNRRRLTVEAWRDAVLAASGRLDLAIGGHSIDPAAPEQRRRTIYSERSRLQLNPMLALFDAPDPNAHADRRVETTTPLQKLFVLNSPFMVEQAKWFTERLEREAGDDDRALVDRAYRLLYSRPPQAEEVELGLAFLSGAAGDRQQRRTQYAQVLLASNEVLVLD